MKKILLSILISLLTFVAVNAQEYVVKVDSWLNVRNSGNENASVIGRLTNGDRVYVHQTENGWAKITYNGKDAYVNQDYLVLTPVYQGNIPQKKPQGFFWGFVILAIVMFVFCAGSDISQLDNFRTVLFVVIALVELVYYFCFSYLPIDAWSSPFGFNNPGEVGFFRAAANSVAYFVFVAAQVFAFIQFTDSDSEDLSFGVSAGAIFVATHFFSGFFFQIGGWLAIILTVGFLICQAIQFFKIIADSYSKRRGFIKATAYLMCVCATALVAIQVKGWFEFLMEYIAS